MAGTGPAASSTAPEAPLAPQLSPEERQIAEAINDSRWPANESRSSRGSSGFLSGLLPGFWRSKGDGSGRGSSTGLLGSSLGGTASTSLGASGYASQLDATIKAANERRGASTLGATSNFLKGMLGAGACNEARRNSAKK
eukprot:TRINITY_DN4569_c0_g1_i1.p1 TRINITY_DN4569_c0_g1~~TRINITY_DN4569_c0_g1_i1.p1  ORF type:complete len:140 (+),score=24.02 TRINITY_DN4569_c0_g1_i1:134-553(+)